MNAQDEVDRAFWKRVAKLLGAHLYGWSYQHSAAFVDPQIEVDGRVAAKLIEQDDEISRLRTAFATKGSNNA